MAGMNISPDVWQAKYGGGQQAYAGAPVQSLIQGLATPEETQIAYDANGNGASGGGQRAFYRANGFDIVPLPNGQYAVYRAGSPEAGAEALNGTPYDIYDASGKFVGSRTWSGLGDKVGDLWEKAVPLATTAMIGGGIAGGFGYGPFAGSGAAAGVPGAVGTGGGFVGEGALSGVGAWDAALAGTPAWTGAAGAGAAGLGAGGGGGAAGAGGAGAAAAGGGAGVPANPFFGGGAASGSSLFGGSGGFDWTSLIGPATQLAGGYMASQAAGKASDAQLQATREAAALLEPFRQFGIKGGNKLMDLLGLSGNTGAEGYGSAMRDFTAQDFLDNKDPAYGILQQEGEQGMQRAASAAGGLGSGKFLKDAMRFNQGLASKEYGNAWNRYQSNRASKINPLLSLLGGGQTASNTIGDFRTQGGNAQAAGTVGKANAWTNAMGQGYSMYQQNQLMDRLLPRGMY